MKEIQNLFSIPKNTQELIQKMFFFKFFNSMTSKMFLDIIRVITTSKVGIFQRGVLQAMVHITDFIRLQKVRQRCNYELIKKKLCPIVISMCYVNTVSSVDEILCLTICVMWVDRG